MTLSNVVRVFNSKRQLLQSTGDFSEAWSLLLGFVEHSALSKNNEVSSFQHHCQLKLNASYKILKFNEYNKRHP
jgi:C-terminal region of Mon2 protein